MSYKTARVESNPSPRYFLRGKLENSDHVRLDEETMIKDLKQEKVYKYLGVDESCGIQHATMKQKLETKLI